jgi:hypothetical protein
MNLNNEEKEKCSECYYIVNGYGMLMCRYCQIFKNIDQVRRDLKRRGWFPGEIKVELSRLRAEIKLKSKNYYE